MGQRRLSVDLCAGLLEMEQVESALYELWHGFARINISHVELGVKKQAELALEALLHRFRNMETKQVIRDWSCWRKSCVRSSSCAHEAPNRKARSSAEAPSPSVWAETPKYPG